MDPQWASMQILTQEGKKKGSFLFMQQKVLLNRTKKAYNDF